MNNSRSSGVGRGPFLSVVERRACRRRPCRVHAAIYPRNAAKKGSWSTKFEANSTQSNYYAQVSSVFPTSYMGGSTSSSDSGPNGGFTSGYYSWWLYIDAGFVDQSGWESHLGWDS